MSSERPARRLQDILDNARLIQSYLQGMDRFAFDTDNRTRDAVERFLERLCEAATKLGVEAEALAPGVTVAGGTILGQRACATPMTRWTRLGYGRSQQMTCLQ